MSRCAECGGPGCIYPPLRNGYERHCPCEGCSCPRPERTEMTDVTQYKPGDKISLEHPDGSLIMSREVDSVYAIKVGKRLDYIRSFLDEGWFVTRHEPAVVLPTEDGFYVSSNPPHPYERIVVKRGVNFVELLPHGVEPMYPAEELIRTWSSEGRLTLLRPVDEVRRETMTELLKDLDEADIAPHHVVRWLRDYRFGLVSE